MIKIEDGYIVESVEYREIVPNIAVDWEITKLWTMNCWIKETKYKVNLETGLLEEVKD